MGNTLETMVIKPETKFNYSDKEYEYLNKSSEEALDNKISEIKDYMIKNHGKGKSNSEKDELYLESQKIWKSLINTLEKTKYNFYLNKDQWKFLTDLILNKLEYDVNTVFFAIELKELFDVMKTTKYSGSEVIAYEVTATEITYIYHLISKHKVKGLSKESYLFSQILLTIGNISKIFNYYDTTGKNLSADIKDWVVTFEDGVYFEKRKPEVIES
jgi:hypothetical protein